MQLEKLKYFILFDNGFIMHIFLSLYFKNIEKPET